MTTAEGVSRWNIRQGDALEVLRTMLAGSVRCCVTSPPYWGLRDYGAEGQIGMERTPSEYVARLVDVFREVRRVLADDGTLWVNLGDSYAGSGYGNHTINGDEWRAKAGLDERRTRQQKLKKACEAEGIKPKDLVGIPWRVAFALQADGWYLRSDIIWSKPNPMPESVTDRPTKAHEYVFLLSKSPRYFFDADAVREDHASGEWWIRPEYRVKGGGNADRQDGGQPPHSANVNGRNVRSVWTITTKPYAGAHFATFPPELPERCIRAGSAPGDIVLDVFNGSGTTGAVAVALGRRYEGIEINPAYIALAHERIARAAEETGGLTREEADRVERAQLGLFAP